MNRLAESGDFDDLFRSQLEEAMNDLFNAELTAFLGYEPYSQEGYNTGNSRNGSYTRTLDTKYGKLNFTRLPAKQ
ncbi:transposase [Streptococcus danieliae]|uniref:Transposase n=1 Tax=Streptococcus danieliae TaxID=747656 RepID=A0A7Z0LDC9_9STRE|nr:transposase [Streptococcus danieliae]NYS49263.1 transposase [Streptococcus danieliae]